jgi:hypothetical protein
MSPIISTLANASARGYRSFAAAAAGPAYESIATVTASGGENILTLTSIPQTYKSLQIRGIIRSQRALNTVGGIEMYFNSDNAGTNYIGHILQGTGSSVSANARTGGSFFDSLGWYTMPFANIASNTYGASITDIHDYTSSNNKTVRLYSACDTNDTTGVLGLFSGLWINSAAITSITFNSPGTNYFAAGTSFALYGIKG